MASDPYFDTYKRYKAGTSELVTWLADTARTCGASSLSTTKAKYTIAVRDFTQLANIIVNSTEPKVEIPAGILEVTKDVISARKRCAKWALEKIGLTNPTRAEGDGHWYFIQVLEQVFDILDQGAKTRSLPKPKIAAPAKPRQDPGQASKGGETYTLTNLFGHLDLEEPVAPTTGLKAPAKSSAKCIDYEIEISKEDKLFAVFCLLLDFDDVRSFVQDVWTRYKIGQVSLISAALLTNTAFEIIQRACGDFTSSFPEFAETEWFYGFLKAHLLVFIEESKPLAEQSRASKVMQDWGTFGIHRLACMSTYSALEVFVETYRTGQFYDSRPIADDEWLEPSDNEEPHVRLIARAVPDFVFLMIVASWFPCADELTKGLGAMYETRKIPLRLVFATEIFCDIHYVLREDVGRGFSEMQRLSTRALANMAEYSKFAQPLGENDVPGTWKQVQGLIRRFVFGDVVAKARQETGQQATIDVIIPYYVFKHNPVLCGLTAFGIVQRTHEGAIEVANAWRVILSTAHLYNAVRQSGYLTTFWTDMDELIALQTPGHVFVGNPPSDLKRHENHLWLALGISAKVFAARGKNWRPNLATPWSGMQSDSIRLLRSRSPVFDIFHQRWHHNIQRSRPGVELHNVEQMLNKMVNSDPAHGAAAMSNEVAEQWKKTHKMSPIQLLSTLRTSIQREEPYLHFNYVAFNARCFNLLSHVQSELRKRIPAFHVHDETGSSTAMHIFVVNVFHIVSNLDEEASSTGGRLQPLPRNKVKTESLWLKEAGKAMRDIIERERDVEMKKARGLCGRS